MVEERRSCQERGRGVPQASRLGGAGALCKRDERAARALEIDGEKRARAGRAGRYHDEERLEPWMGAAAGGSGPWGGVRSCWWTARALE